jgi:chromosomal replication initiation ATPase DnaA
MITTSPIETAPANDVTPARSTAYGRYAEIFSSVHRETGSIEIALEVLDAHRARQEINPPKPDLPTRVLAVAASLFYVKPKRLLERDRHEDLARARWVAMWLLNRRHWKPGKIALFLGLDRTTVIYGLRRVANDHDLLVAAHKAELMLADDPAAHSEASSAA